VAMSVIAYRSVEVQGLKIAYREAGDISNPTLLLLHGFPTAGHMFRDLIPRLMSRFHLLAPDLPGFGQTELPAPKTSFYSFARLTEVMSGFIAALNLKKFALYIFDYGAPVGLRLALHNPESITAIVSQNGNVYEEGLSPGWDSMKVFWAKPTSEYRESLRSAFTADAIRGQYVTGTADPDLISPDGWSLDRYYLERPGAEEAQLDLFQDYGSNVALYPKFQEYFRRFHPPILAIWGKHDPYFLPIGADAFRRDNPSVRVEFLDTGHFALETHSDEIARAIITFFDNDVLGKTEGGC
jgi:pimeloyl-ACP methyl ester carboxylesterase